jgi:nucleotide-binding universal stress UspA family protein
MFPFKRIVAATDFGPSSQSAVELATKLAKEHGAKLTLVHAYAVYVAMYPIAVAPTIEGVREAATGAMDRVIQSLRAHLPDVEGFVRHGDAWTEIVDQAAECSADLIVMGTHGHRGVSRLFLGSVAERVVRCSPVPVLTVRHQESEAHATAAE